ncbi:MAG: ADP-ribosylglycohydrolase family protein [bacterium]
MSYPEVPDYRLITEQIGLYAQLKHEYGAAGISPLLAEAEAALNRALEMLKALPESTEVAAREPNNLAGIQALRPQGPRNTWSSFNEAEYRERLSGALLGRFAGCTLGAPVEFWDVSAMEDWAKELGTAFPPVDYWTEIPNRHHKRYGVSRCDAYTRDKMDGVPVDDDITYTILGLLIAEDYTRNFTIAEIGEGWVKYLPYACTAEDIALKNLTKGISAEKAGETDNPFCEWIGADIRSDAWGYLAPGQPEFAAKMAYNDAYLSHRRNGIYGEMFFSAAIAAAFTVDHPVKALEIALTEIPADCDLARDVRWALDVAPSITNYREARAAMDDKFKGMHCVHTNNNACLTIWGLTIGGTDFTRVISEVVAMGMDNDCTAATAGSIVGAVVGKAGIPPHWYARYNDTVHTYINGHPHLAISDVIDRFTTLAGQSW